jgi:TRAP-type C4-dicarboxylate transport system substrate-binding protein
MIKVLLIWLVFLSGAAVVFLPAASFAQSKSTMNIRFSTWHPSGSIEVKTVWIPMLEELKKRSNGRITYTLYAGGALGTGPEHYGTVAKGISDMGYFLGCLRDHRFPKLSLLLPAMMLR